MATKVAIDENGNINMMTDETIEEAAAMLVKLYGEYYKSCGGFGDDELYKYAKAVSIAIRMMGK